MPKYYHRTGTSSRGRSHSVFRGHGRLPDRGNRRRAIRRRVRRSQKCPGKHSTRTMFRRLRARSISSTRGMEVHGEQEHQWQAPAHPKRRRTVTAGQVGIPQGTAEVMNQIRNSTLRRFTPLRRSTKPIPRFRFRPRRGPFRDADYRRWVRMTQACCCCGKRPCDPAHTGNVVGTSQKADDRTIVPLCVRDCHTRYHSRDGERGRALEREYSVQGASGAERRKTLPELPWPPANRCEAQLLFGML